VRLLLVELSIWANEGWLENKKIVRSARKFTACGISFGFNGLITKGNIIKS
jgi:hypothetical protein